MAKYHLTHTCGHIVTHNLVGKHADRDRKIEWLESCKCMDCVRDDELIDAKKKNDGLAVLEGSEKQIAWAEKIRAEKMDDVNHWLKKAESENPPADIRSKMDDCLVKLQNIKSASTWIDFRSETGLDLIRKYFQN